MKNSSLSNSRFEYEESGDGYLVSLGYQEQKTSIGGVNEGVKNLFLLIQEIPGKSAPFFAHRMDTSVKTIERWLKDLKDEDRIKFSGAPKTGGYFVK